MSRPLFNLVAKNKKTKENVKVGAVWPAKFGGGALNISFVTEPYNEKEAHISDVTANPDDYFFTLYPVEEKGAEKPTPKAAGRRPADRLRDDLDF